MDINAYFVHFIGHYKTEILRGKNMSTYLIAGAIERFSKDFKEVISEKNKIEREKLEFEREKFEFNKKQLQLNESLLKESLKEGSTSKECEHKWESFIIIDQGGLRRRTEYCCSKCGAIKT